MNPDFIFNSVADKTLNKFAYRPYPLNEEPYEKLKRLNNNKKCCGKRLWSIDFTKLMNSAGLNPECIMIGLFMLLMMALSLLTTFKNCRKMIHLLVK
jgi:hypothetical protein